jgi:hypothetical protein
VASSSTGDSRLRGARPFDDVQPGPDATAQGKNCPVFFLTEKFEHWIDLVATGEDAATIAPTAAEPGGRSSQKQGNDDCALIVGSSARTNQVIAAINALWSGNIPNTLLAKERDAAIINWIKSDGHLQGVSTRTIQRAIDLLGDPQRSAVKPKPSSS